MQRTSFKRTDEVEVIGQPPSRHKLKVKGFDFGVSARWLESRVLSPARRGALSPRESVLAERIKILKRDAGSHSPSAPTLAKMIPELRMRVDACFLSNPYATDLFLEYMNRELIRTGKLRKLLEFYPSQNRVIAGKLSHALGIDSDHLFVGNGAIEIIQAILHRFTGSKILVNLPTFSPYHEFARPDTQVVFNYLSKEDDFRFDPEAYLDRVRRERPDTVVLINPNNPDGGYISYATLVRMLEELRHVPNIIVDESFIHFACEGDDYAYRSLTGEIDRFPNLMVVKSMSKDFGVAGIRAGYAVMAPSRVDSLLSNGFLWNSSGLAEYFFDLYSRPDFLIEYERQRIRYIRYSRRFFSALASFPGLYAYPTNANFILIELRNGMTAEDLVCRLLVRRGIYTRTCDDKKGLDPGRFIRVASRCRSENRFVLRAFRDALK
jgi:histidinol-phosphate/aromatic aminotransferase/cobyric acid decarboxylase-like protein